LKPKIEVIAIGNTDSEITIIPEKPKKKGISFKDPTPQK
jgi:hypothetical protein